MSFQETRGGNVPEAGQYHLTTTTPKDPTAKERKYRLCYKIQCEDCEGNYVEETGKAFGTRLTKNNNTGKVRLVNGYEGTPEALRILPGKALARNVSRHPLNAQYFKNIYLTFT